MSTQKPPTWFDWVASHIANRKAALSKRWDGYSASSILVLTEAEHAARSLRCGAVGVEHLLAGFIKREGTRVALLLRSVGLTLNTLESEIEYQGRDAVVYEAIPFTPRCKRVVQRASERAGLEGTRLVEPEDLFLELLEEKEGLVADLFRKLGVNVAALRAALKP